MTNVKSQLSRRAINMLFESSLQRAQWPWTVADESGTHHLAQTFQMELLVMYHCHSTDWKHIMLACQAAHDQMWWLVVFTKTVATDTPTLHRSSLANQCVRF